MTLKELQEKKLALSGKMSALIASASAAGGTLDEEQAKSFKAHESEFRSLTEHENFMRAEEQARQSMDRLQTVQLANIGSEQRESGDAADTARLEQQKQYAAAHAAWRLGGSENLNTEMRAALSRGSFRDGSRMALTPATGAGGGFTIPTTLDDQLTVAIKFYGGMSMFSRSLPTPTGNPFDFPTANDTANTGEIVGPNTTVSQALPSFGLVPFTAYKFSSKIVPVPIELMQDSIVDLDKFLVDNLSIRIWRIQNQKFTVGVGPSGSEPTGIVTAAAAAGNVYVQPAGNTNKVGPDDLVNLEHSVDPLYRAGAKYMFHDSTLQYLKKLKDNNGRPLWLPSLASGMNGGFPPTVNDYPYVINNDMPVLGASNYPMVFGNPDNFVIRTVTQTVMVRFNETYMASGQIGFLAFKRADSNLIDAGTHPVALMQNSAT